MYCSKNEFFVYDPEFKGEHGDFTDDAVFTPQERLEYLEEYAAFLKTTHHLGEESEYVIPFEDAVHKCKEIDSVEIGKDIVFKEMDAHLCETEREYRDWNFYTAKTVCEDGCLVLKNADLPPNPAAMYWMESKERVKNIKLEFFMESEFYAPLTENVFVCTPGRTIELRNGLKDIVKIQIYSNGEVYAKTYMVNAYEPKHILLGNIEFDKWNTLEIMLGKTEYSVKLGDKLEEHIPLAFSDNPDSMFFCGGMFHYGDWKIKPIAIEYSNQTITEFFIQEAENIEGPKKEVIGKVSLPYAVGGFDNRDKTLVLEKEFTVEKDGRCVLQIDSLDPGGEVWLDGECIASTDSFDSFEIDITSKVTGKEQKHLLQIRVNPRAPEVLYEWHRHKDTYIGWFCEKVTLKIYDDVELTELQAITKKVGKSISENGEREIEAVFKGAVSTPCTVAVSIAQFWNGKSEVKEICKIEAEKEFDINATFMAHAWNTDRPSLYAVRFAAYDKDGQLLGEEVIETGFRTIEQKNGAFYLNGERILLNGALQMQFLPPYKETPVTHICPRSEQIVWQDMMLKALNGNTMRLHMLGYGSNDERYAKYADRLGVLLIWITRYIDSVQGCWWGKWRAKEAYLRQVKARINHPSIVIWEGANELRLNLKQTDDIHNEFVPAVKSVDESRLLSPVNHLYYSGNDRRCKYYNDAGTEDQLGNSVCASKYWTDPQVIRSAHPYSLLLGYGCGWHMLRTGQHFNTPRNLFGDELPNLYNSSERGYVASEFAVIGRQDPNTKEAREEYFNSYSYEFPDEKVLGIEMNQDRWLVSQAYQALAVQETTKKMMLNDVDGMLWCCLLGGANDGGYLKPIIDNYGYAKLAFYVMRDAFDKVYATTDDVDMKKGKNFAIRPVLYGEVGKNYDLNVRIVDANDNVVAEQDYNNIYCEQRIVQLGEWRPQLSEPGYYSVQFETTRSENILN